MPFGTCEMCGAEGSLTLVALEGAEMYVCKKCAKFGTPILSNASQTENKKKIKKKKSSGHGFPRTYSPPPRPRARRSSRSTLEDQVLKENYGDVVRSARQRLGLTTRELAMKIKETEGVIKRVESGKMIPDRALVQKLEKFLNITLYEAPEIDVEALDTDLISDEGATLGSIAKIKKKKVKK